MSRQQTIDFVHNVLTDLNANGYTVTGAFDGIEWMEQADLKEAINDNDLNSIVSWVSGTDIGSISLRDSQGETFQTHLIYGNDPQEVVSDMSASSPEALSRGEHIVECCINDWEDNEPSSGPTL